MERMVHIRSRFQGRNFPYDRRGLRYGGSMGQRIHPISWNKDSRILREEGIPNSFNFNGSIIFITNKSFDTKKAGKMQPHLDALQSRCHFLDLTVDSERDKMLRIKQVHRDADGGLFVDYDFTQEQTDEIMSFIWDNHSKLREVSLRMCLKVADLVKISANWRELAKKFVLFNGTSDEGKNIQRSGLYRLDDVVEENPLANPTFIISFSVSFAPLCNLALSLSTSSFSS